MGEGCTGGLEGGAFPGTGRGRGPRPLGARGGDALKPLIDRCTSPTNVKLALKLVCKVMKPSAHLCEITLLYQSSILLLVCRGLAYY